MVLFGVCVCVRERERERKREREGGREREREGEKLIVCTHNFDLHLTKSRKECEAGNKHEKMFCLTGRHYIFKLATV